MRAHAAEIAAFDPRGGGRLDLLCADKTRKTWSALFPKVRRVVFISSVDAYGEDIGAGPVTEERAPAPVTDYGKNKLACEKVLFDKLGRKVTAFRPSHILGRGFLTTSLWGRTPYLVDRIRQGKVIPAIDGGRNVMTPVYAGDIAEWILRSLDNSGGRWAGRSTLSAGDSDHTKALL